MASCLALLSYIFFPYSADSSRVSESDPEGLKCIPVAAEYIVLNLYLCLDTTFFPIVMLAVPHYYACIYLLSTMCY